MTQTSIEINGKLHFSQSWDGETWKFTRYFKRENILDTHIWRDLQFYQN